MQLPALTSSILEKRDLNFSFLLFSVFLGTVFSEHVSGFKNQLRTKDYTMLIKYFSCKELSFLLSFTL